MLSLAGVVASTAAPVNWLEIFDATTGTLLCSPPTGSTCTVTEAGSVATTHDFAYVAGFDPQGTFPPPKGAATSPPVAVTWVPLHHIPV